MKSLKRAIIAINDAGGCVLVNNQIRKKSDFTKVIQVRQETIRQLIDDNYIDVRDDTVIHLLANAVVMLPKKDKDEWIRKQF